jgi:hypothetical protein
LNKNKARTNTALITAISIYLFIRLITANTS